jgi:N-acetylglucosaminyldiphosphoundecaprenol N-acetyl-beta-D-mannosaminyltransferase
MPNQEKWIAKNGDSLNAVAIGVGAAFNFYAGQVAMAPSWMQDRGLSGCIDYAWNLAGFGTVTSIQTRISFFFL